MVRFDSVVLFVEDVQVSKEFYSKLFGFSIKYDFGASVSFEEGVSLWKVGEEHVLKPYQRKKSKSGKDFELYFETEDLDKILNELKNYSMEYIHELREESWGQRVVRFYDPDLHVLEIGESVSAFVLRLLREGMLKEEVEQKTGVSLELINEFLSNNKK